MQMLVIAVILSYSLVCLEKLAFGNIFCFLENVFSDPTEDYRVKRDKRVSSYLYKFIGSLLLAGLVFGCFSLL